MSGLLDGVPFARRGDLAWRIAFFARLVLAVTPMGIFCPGAALATLSVGPVAAPWFVPAMVCRGLLRRAVNGA